MHLFRSNIPGKNCIAQLLDAFDGTTSVIGAGVSEERALASVAVMSGAFTRPDTVAVREMCEKPSTAARGV